MASIHTHIIIDAQPAQVWDALRDWSALHERLAPGFVADTRLDGSDRIVTFANGRVVREVLVGLDEDNRRLAWSVVDGPYSHHNGSAQVRPTPEGTTEFVWIADLLPDAAAPVTAEMMESGLGAIKRAMERTAAASAR